MTEYEEDKREKREMIEARRLKNSTSDGGAGLAPDSQQRIVPVTGKEKWDNYWYHYKGLTFGLAFAAALVLLFVLQLVFRTQHDSFLTVVSQTPLDTVTKDISSKLIPFTEETTGNDQLNPQISVIQLDFEGKYGGNPQMTQGSVTKLIGQISSNESFVYLVDRSAFQYLVGMDAVFLDLTTLTEPARLDSNQELYPVKGTQFASRFEYPELLDEMYLCIIDLSEFPEHVQKKKQVVAAYDRDMTMLKKIIAAS